MAETQKRTRRTKAQIEIDNAKLNETDTSHEDVMQEIIDSVKPKTRGIILIALGHTQYGNMAYNLARSIRFNDKDLPIHLVYTESAVSQIRDFSLFTSKEVCPKEYYTKGTKTVFIKAKTHLYDLSPFDETIFIDVDAVLFGGKNINGLFDEFKDVNFTAENYGVMNETKQHNWFNFTDAVNAYSIEKPLYEIRSQFIYFKKCDEIKAYFDTVKDIFENPKIKGALFDNDLPDEFAFNIATGIHGIKPHKDNYIVIYWMKSDGKSDWQSIVRNYIGISIGGNYLSKKESDTYHNLMKAQAGTQPYFKIYSKKSWNKARKAI